MLSPRDEIALARIFKAEDAETRRLKKQAEQDAKAKRPASSTHPVYTEEYSLWRTWMITSKAKPC